MRTLKSLSLAVVGGLLVASSLPAQTAGQVQWKGVNGAWSGYSNSASGSNPWYVYTSPYLAAFNIPGNTPNSVLLPPSGDGSFGPTVDIFCVDFVHEADNGTYNAWFTNLGTDPLTKTRFGAGGLVQYLEAAYLAQQIEAVGANTTAAAEMNGAIWQIMNGEPTYLYTGGTWDASGIASYVAQAASDYNTVTASNWVVVTDQASNGANGGGQEYITQVTPEPATMILLGTGLLIMMAGAGAVKRLAA